MLTARDAQLHPGMPLLFAALMPLIVVVVGGVALSRTLRAAPVRTDDRREQVSARRWLVLCMLLLARGPGTHGIISVVRSGTIPADAIFGFWFLIPMLWYLYDWDRTWQRLVAEGGRLGYGVNASVSLLRFVTGGIALMRFWLLFLSLSGTELPPSYPSHSAPPMAP